jgi:hypothetical protein
MMGEIIIVSIVPILNILKLKIKKNYFQLQFLTH